VERKGSGWPTGPRGWFSNTGGGLDGGDTGMAPRGIILQPAPSAAEVAPYYLCYLVGNYVGNAGGRHRSVEVASLGCGRLVLNDSRRHMDAAGNVSREETSWYEPMGPESTEMDQILEGEDTSLLMLIALILGKVSRCMVSIMATSGKDFLPAADVGVVSGPFHALCADMLRGLVW